MKSTFFLIISLLLALRPASAQPNDLPEISLANKSARGHYKTLAAFDGKARHALSRLDTMKFPVTSKQTESMKTKPPYYLAADPSLIIVPAPPENSSLQTRKELDYLLQLQKHRSEDDVRASLFYAGVWYNVNSKPADETYQYFQKNLFHIGRSIGTWFNPDSLPLTRHLLANAWRDANYFIWHYKYHFARIRPYKLDTSIRNLEQTNWAAYPSGHAGNSYVAAYIYNELAPEFNDFFVKDAYDMAHSREIIGVHYPSDSESARVMARQLVDLLLKDEKFIKDLKAAQQEWKMVRARNF